MPRDLAIFCDDMDCKRLLAEWQWLVGLWRACQRVIESASKWRAKFRQTPAT